MAAGRGAPGCAQVQDYAAGTAVMGEFTASDCFNLNSGLRQPTDYWRIRTNVQRDIYAIVEAPGMALRLRLLTEDGTEIKTDEFVNPFAFLNTQVPAGGVGSATQRETRSTGNRLERGCGAPTLRKSDGADQATLGFLFDR